MKIGERIERKTQNAHPYAHTHGHILEKKEISWIPWLVRFYLHPHAVTDTDTHSHVYTVL